MKSNKTLKTIFVSVLTIATIIPLISSASASAATDVCSGNLPPEIMEANGCNTTSSSNGFSNAIVSILNGIVGIAGLVAVIFIIIGGINYMTSAGDSNKIKKGKDTILYALVGLIVCALAFAIVNWVIVGIIN